MTKFFQILKIREIEDCQMEVVVKIEVQLFRNYIAIRIVNFLPIRLTH